MRFFDWKCPACKAVEEHYENFEDKEKEHICEACGFPMERLIGAPIINFKTKSANWDLKHSERRKRWNSKDKRDVLSI